MKIEKQASVVAAGTPEERQLADINRLAKAQLTAEDVYVFAVRLCDDQVDRDFERFSAQALEKLAELFVGKTGVVDHAWSAEKQVARVFAAGVEHEPGVSFVKAWAYMLRSEKNAEIIAEIEAGIKKEVSVGCAVGRSICSVCGTEYGSCEHRKGQKYGGEICVAVLCEPEDAYEFSFVAVPAQKEAGVLRKQVGGGHETAAERKRLEEEAALGRLYRKELEDSFVKLALSLELGLKEQALRQMSGALEAKQLIGCRDALQKQAEKRYPLRMQLAQREEFAGSEQDSAFLI